MSNTSTPITVPVELDTTKLDRYLQHIKEERELEREENLYKKLPLLIREIILDATLPLPTCKDLVEREIEEIKKITNAECESALEMFKKRNQVSKN